MARPNIYSFFPLKGTSWRLGGGWHNGICSLSGKVYKKNTPILWLPDAISKDHGITVLHEEYLKIGENKIYQEIAKKINLELNLKELNPREFFIS